MHQIKSFKTKDEWHAWRAQGIGGSDAPKVMNLSRFGDRLDVWLEKTGQIKPKPINYALDVAANVAEEAARRRLIIDQAVKTELKPVNVQLIAQPFIRASLDGYNADGVLFEHKMVGELAFDELCHLIKGKQWQGFDDLHAILTQIAYQSYIIKPKRVILGLTSFVTKRWAYFELSKADLPSPTKTVNRVKKLWNLIESYKASQTT